MFWLLYQANETSTDNKICRNKISIINIKLYLWQSRIYLLYFNLLRYFYVLLFLTVQLYGIRKREWEYYLLWYESTYWLSWRMGWQASFSNAILAFSVVFSSHMLYLRFVKMMLLTTHDVSIACFSYIFSWLEWFSSSVCDPCVYQYWTILFLLRCILAALVVGQWWLLNNIFVLPMTVSSAYFTNMFFFWNDRLYTWCRCDASMLLWGVCASVVRFLTCVLFSLLQKYKIVRGGKFGEYGGFVCWVWQKVLRE